MKKIISKAFSLVELMVTLIVVSCLIAAMAPVITKKLKSSSITIGSSGGNSGELSMDCSKFGSSCGLCYPNKCVSCVKSCTENQALDIAQCSCIECSEKYGSTCLRCDVESCSKCADTNYIDNGICKTCDSGNYCDGTNMAICPAGFYCTDGAKTQCPIGTYNNSEGKTTISDCKTCSSKTPNCTTCDRTTGLCEACENGYDLASEGCITTEFLYTYTGSYSETTSTGGKQKIILKSSGTFTPSKTQKATLFLVGGGGGGTTMPREWTSGSGGGGGYTNETKFTFVSNTGYIVVVGAGGASATNGSETKFDTISAEGGKKGGSLAGGAGTGKGGGGGDADWNTCRTWALSGSNGITFDGTTYGGGGGGGALASSCGSHNGGNGGGGAGGNNWCTNGSDGTVNTGGGGGDAGCSLWGCSLTGGKGGSGVVVIIVD